MGRKNMIDKVAQKHVEMEQCGNGTRHSGLKQSHYNCVTSPSKYKMTPISWGMVDKGLIKKPPLHLTRPDLLCQSLTERLMRAAQVLSPTFTLELQIMMSK